MKEQEVQAVTRRIGVQLRSNRFGLCHLIIDELEKAWRQRHDPPTAIAELDIPQRLVELLDREGYVYVSDLEDVDVDRWNLVGLGVTYKKELKAALGDARGQKERADLRAEQEHEMDFRLGLPCD